LANEKVNVLVLPGPIVAGANDFESVGRSS
jgi:hypothetical protein